MNFYKSLNKQYKFDRLQVITYIYIIQHQNLILCYSESLS